MVSGEAARPLGVAAARPQTTYKKPAGAAPRPPAGPGVGEGGRRASWVTCARRGPWPLPRCARACRPPGAAAVAAWRRRRPESGGRAAGSPSRGARLPGGGLGAGPRSHFVLCKSHESCFPRAGAAMPAAEGRARAPLCSAKRAAAVSVSSPRAPGGAAPAPAPLPAPGLPPLLPPRLAHSLTPRLPGPAPSSLRSLQSASRLNLALWAAWSESSWRGSKMGASARRGAAGPRAPGTPCTRSIRHPGVGLRLANVFGQKPVLGRVCLSQSSSSCLFCGGSRCFCSLREGKGRLGVGRACFSS